MGGSEPEGLGRADRRWRVEGHKVKEGEEDEVGGYGLAMIPSWLAWGRPPLAVVVAEHCWEEVT